MLIKQTFRTFLKIINVADYSLWQQKLYAHILETFLKIFPSFS